MRTVALAIACLAIVAAPGWAESPPPPPDPPTTDWAPIETVTVTAQAAGPAFWHVKKGESEIWILGTVSPMPKGLAWNSAHLAGLIKGARAVLTAPTASAGLFETSWFLLTHRGLLSMPDGQKLEDTLPPELKARYVAARTAIKLEAVDDDPPILAAQKLVVKYTEVHDLANAEPWDTVRRIAKDNHVPVRPIGEYGALGMVKEMLRLPQDGQHVCLEEAVAFTEYETTHNQPLTAAWAAGNLQGVKAHFVPDAFGKCIKQSATFGKVADRAVGDYLKVIRESLAQPGKVVMLADIGSLLRSTGVAEVLHKEGVIIEGPPE